MCWIMSCPDGWKGILAGIMGYFANSVFFLLPVSGFNSSCLAPDGCAPLRHRRLIMKRRATPSLVPLTNESRQRWSGSPPATARTSQMKKKKKKRDLLMLDRFSLHIHYWAGWWAEKCELPAGCTVRTSGRDALWCVMKILNSVCNFFFPPLLKIMSSSPKVNRQNGFELRMGTRCLSWAWIQVCAQLDHSSCHSVSSESKTKWEVIL